MLRLWLYRYKNKAFNTIVLKHEIWVSFFKAVEIKVFDSFIQDQVYDLVLDYNISTHFLNM